MAATHEQCQTMMKRLLSTCVERDFVQESMCDEIIQEFADFMHTAAKSELESYSIQDDRLDTLLRSRMIVMYQKPGLS